MVTTSETVRAENAADVAHRIGARRSGAGYSFHCPCPGHGRTGHDRTPSAFMADRSDAKGGVYVECFSGCDWKDLRAALKLPGPEVKAKPPDKALRPAPRPTIDNDGDRTKNALRIWREA